MRGVDRVARMGGRGVARLDVSLAIVIVMLIGASAFAVLGLDFPGVTDARALDIAINVAAILVGAAVGILAWVRWRETGEPVALYESGAFVALTLTNMLMIGAVILGTEREFGLSPDMPGEAPIYLWTITRLTAGFLLVIGATRSLDRQ